jgi:hypothetical protein
MTPELWRRASDAMTNGRATVAERLQIRAGVSGINTFEQMPLAARKLLLQLESRTPIDA